MSGQALAAKVLLDELRRTHDIEVINLSVASRSDGTVTVRRTIEVVKILKQVFLKRKIADAIYFTISESLAGNIKDLLIYLLCVKRLSKMYIHLHGGTIKQRLFDRYGLLHNVNALFIRRLAGVIVSGDSHLPIFADMIERHRIHVVPNFAQDNLFVAEQAIVGKFAQLPPLRVLYVSSMTRMKGFNDLVDAYACLEESLQKKVRIDFAGRFASETQRTMFLNKIAAVEGIRYHGIVEDSQKQQLFAQAHVFCLPTTHLEGQPISILEAYAAGCVVLTTGKAGIRDVFTHRVNGYEIQARSATSIAVALESLIGDSYRLLEIALKNRRAAESRYRTVNHNVALRRIIEASVCAPDKI